MSEFFTCKHGQEAETCNQCKREKFEGVVVSEEYVLKELKLCKHYQPLEGPCYGCKRPGTICKHGQAVNCNECEYERKNKRRRPNWTVCYNIVSPENDRWTGTGWEFFDDEKDAEKCYLRHTVGEVGATKRPYYENTDFKHLGAAHQWE